MRRVCGEPVQARHTAWSSRSRLDLANTLVVMSLLFGFRAPHSVLLLLLVSDSAR